MNFPEVKGEVTRDVNQLLPTVVILTLAALYECKRRGIPVLLSQTWRSEKAQHQDYLSGKSKVDGLKGMHPNRVAEDMYTDPKRTGGKLYHEPSLQAAANVFKSFGATWGGDWDNDGRTDDEKFRDWPHIQWVSVEEQKIIYQLKTSEAIESWLRKKYAPTLVKIKKSGVLNKLGLKF